MKINVRIKQLRQGMGITQSDMADKLGITKFHYNRVEMGHNDPSMDLLRAVSDVTGTELTILLEGKRSIKAVSSAMPTLKDLRGSMKSIGSLDEVNPTEKLVDVLMEDRNGKFDRIEPNIYGNGKCYQVRKMTSDGIMDEYFWDIESAREFLK